MTDDDLEHLHRRIEGFSHRTIWAALAVGAMGVLLDSKAIVMVVMLPVLAVSCVSRLPMHVARWEMDRRGIDWDHP